jgi:hypothetical protein
MGHMITDCALQHKENDFAAMHRMARDLAVNGVL